MTKKLPPKSVLLRSALLAKAGATILGKEVASFAKTKISEKVDEVKAHARIEQVRLLTEALSQLKGSAMKFGQMLSLDAQDLLPPEAVQILSKLQKNAEPVSSEVLFEVIKKELGEEKFSLMNLDPEPVGVASIGQVFKGQCQNRKIAVKVQYPGVRDSISSDLKVIRAITGTGLTLFGKQMDLKELFGEIEIVLTNEADYLKEKENLIQYKEMLKDDSRFIVPEVFENFCSQQVITMSFEEGLDLRSWINNKPSLEQRTKIGTAILELFIKEFFKFGFVQTDPNLGNYLVQKDTAKIVLLDFGAVLRYSPEFVKNYGQLIQTIRNGSENEILRFCEEHHFIDQNETDDTKRLFVKMVQTAVEPFDDRHQPFYFGDKDYSSRIRQSVLELSRHAKYTPPPRELIFLHRKLGGMFNVIKMLDLKIDLSAFWNYSFGLNR